LIRKFLTSFRTWRFVDKFTTSHPWNLSWASWTYSSSSHPISSGLSRSLCPTALWTKFYMLCGVSCLVSATSILSSWIWIS